MDDMSKEKIVSYLESALSEVNEMLSVHDNIRADDGQYEDPEEWWLRPVKQHIEAALAATEEFK